MDPDLFANPWEHIRLLSDPDRNGVLIDFLARHAPGRRVLEVGCGTGLLAAIAARMGAEHVWAVEPTPMADVASELMARNGLPVTVLRGRIQDVEPVPVDVAFSELLNADPFYEHVVDAARATRPWLAPGGILAPRRLRVYAAAVRAPSAAREARDALQQVDALSFRFGLDLGPVREGLRAPADHRYVTTAAEAVGPAVVVWDLDLMQDARPEKPRHLALPVSAPGPVAGVMVWFEAPLDDDLVLHNRPGEPSHWGQQVLAFAREQGVARGGTLSVRLEVEGAEVHAHLEQ